MSHADRGWGRQAESLGDRWLTSTLRDLLSAEIQSAQFADLLVRDLDDDDDRTGRREGKWVAPAGQQGDDGPDWAPDLLWLGRPAGSQGPRHSPRSGGGSFLSERDSAQAEATGSPQVLGLGAQHWRLRWLEGLKL